MIYLDNSATSFPKPATVVQAITGYMTQYGASPGHSGHSLSVKAAREVFETREQLARLFHVSASERVIFTANATHALNIAIKGILHHGDHVIISHMEHNSVHRPLRYLQESGIIDLTVVPCDETGLLDPEQIRKSLRPNTRLVVTIHGSNVSGVVQPIRETGKICRESNVVFLVDAAQTAGFIDIDMQRDEIDILAFTGHKKLYGPTGIGGLCINNEEITIETLIHGGTGSKSESNVHPAFYPDKLEAGTLNAVGIIGLKAGVSYVLEKGLETIRRKQLELTGLLMQELSAMQEVRLYGPPVSANRLPVISLNISGIPPSELAHILDREYGIMTRAGLHCAPLAHKSTGSFPQGTVRFSIGAFNTEEHILESIKAIKNIIHNTSK